MRRIAFIISISLILIVLSGLISWKAVEVKRPPTDLIRLHITANTNSFADQLIKRKVREEVLSISRRLLIEVTSTNQAEKVINNNLEYLKTKIQDRLYDLGVDYNVELELAATKFPRRSYGKLTLPAAEYQALNVVLGAGSGENWWCVLFPPLCLVNSEPKSNNKDKSTLSLEQDKVQKQLSVEFKFKFFEYLKENKEFAKLKGKVGSIFSVNAH